MTYSIDLAEGLNYYFGLAFIFLCGYWLAFVYKNLSFLFAKLGIIAFVLLMILFFSVQAVMLPGVEGLADYYYTGAYAVGFFLRFFRHDH